MFNLRLRHNRMIVVKKHNLTKHIITESLLVIMNIKLYTDNI